MGFASLRSFGLLLLVLGQAATGVVPERQFGEFMSHASLRALPPRLHSRADNLKCASTLEKDGSLTFPNANLMGQSSGVLECGALLNWKNVTGRIFRISRVQIEATMATDALLDSLKIGAGFSLNNSTIIPMNYHDSGPMALSDDQWPGAVLWTTNMFADDPTIEPPCAKQDTDTLSLFFQMSMSWRQVTTNIAEPLPVEWRMPLTLRFAGSALSC